MRRKRPCRVCRKWFLAHPRAGSRQKVCSSESCQRERHRRNCEDWRARHPDYDREARLRVRLGPDPEPDAPPFALEGEVVRRPSAGPHGLRTATRRERSCYNWAKTMRVGLTYDLQTDRADWRQAEFDPPETIRALTAALSGLGHEVIPVGNAHDLRAGAGKLGTLELVMNLAEGTFGRCREGWVPTILEHWGIPYVGSDPMAMVSPAA